jgi:hypothetical protein
MRLVLSIALGWALAAADTAAGQWVPYGACPPGQCAPADPALSQAPQAPAPWQVDARAVVQVVNVVGRGRTLGSGTLVDSDGTHGLVLSCAHLFRDGAGSIVVIFADGRSYAARLRKVDAQADLAALEVAAPPCEPAPIAEDYPRRREPLVSCGYGSDGRLACNFGTVLGYVTTAGGYGRETLEMTGAARQGDSGGPVLDRQGRLVAVLFGTNGRVVDATFCGRVRRFLAGLSPRFGAERPPELSPVSPPQPLPEPPIAAAPPSPLEPTTPAPAKPPRSEPPPPEQLERPAPPRVEMPPGADPLGGAADAVAGAAQPWLSAKVTAVLISLGLPGGVAGVAGATIVWVVMRRGKKRLQAELARLRSRLGDPSAAPDETAAEEAASSTVERHHNRYVPYEVSRLDKAWAAAHARVGERYPGAVPYLKIVEGVKDQLLSGIDEPELSEGVS